MVGCSERRSEESLSLRIALDNIQVKCDEWWSAVVLLAKSVQIEYLEFQKILARVFQKHKIKLDGFHTILRDIWHRISC